MTWNQNAEYSFYRVRMRDLKLIKRCLILLALVWAQIPASVLAGMRPADPSCKMPCCKKEVAQPARNESVCDMCPMEGAEQAADSPTQIAINATDDKCPCKIAPRPAPPAHPVVLASSSLNFGDHSSDCILPAPSCAVVFSGENFFTPGIVGTDSGPPSPGQDCVWLGRAPPILVA